MTRRRSKSATLHEVAALAGCSIKTVSRVVNGEDYVSPETAARVLDAVKKLGYVPNLSARRLATRRTHVIAVVFDNASWNWLNDFQRGAFDRAAEFGYETIVHPCDITSAADRDRVVRLAESKAVDGLVLTPPCGDSAPLTRALVAKKTPFVSVAPRHRSGERPTVSTSDYEGAFAMTRALLDLGHRRIAFVRGAASQRSSEDRRRGFAAAVEGTPGARTFVFDGDFSFASGVRAAAAIFALRPRPTAVFASNDDMAAGVLYAAGERGVRVPEELSIAGFDDVDLARQVWPPLATVRQPTTDMARAAVDRLIASIDPKAFRRDGMPTTHVCLETSLVIRSSVGPAPGRGPKSNR